MIERVPPTRTSSTPDPVTAWMAVTGSGVSPRQATLGARARRAGRYRRRLPLTGRGHRSGSSENERQSETAGGLELPSSRESSLPARVLPCGVHRESCTHFGEAASDHLRAAPFGRKHQSPPGPPTIPSCRSTRVVPPTRDEKRSSERIPPRYPLPSIAIVRPTTPGTIAPVANHASRVEPADACFRDCIDAA